MVGEVLGMIAPMAVPGIIGKIPGINPRIPSGIQNAMFVGQAMKEADKNGESPIVAGVQTYAQQKLLFDPINNFVGKAAANAGISGIGGMALNMGVMFGISAIEAGVSAYVQDMQHTAKTMSQAYSNKGKFGSGHFNMTNATYTMRQRSLDAIRQTGANVSSVLGNEARNYALYS